MAEWNSLDGDGSLYGVEIEIIDCIPLNKRKDLRKKPSEKGKEGRSRDKVREETKKKQREQAGV